MLVAVEKIGKITTGKYNDSKNQRIIMTCVDKDDKYGQKYYGLNINPDDTFLFNKWMPYIKEGNVLDVMISKNPQGKYYVDKFCQFTIRRDLNQKQEVS